jgi:hypothetical protein
MPHSDGANKAWVLEKINQIKPRNILDVGTGSGILEEIVRENFGNSIVLDGIEAWEPYISEYSLTERYDNLYNVDARTWDKWDYDLVMFGDVLEHMVESESSDLWSRVSKFAGHAIITIPIIHYPQGASFGNPFEIHHEDHWDTERILRAFPGITEYQEFEITGAYLARFKDEALPKPDLAI